MLVRRNSTMPASTGSRRPGASAKTHCTSSRRLTATDRLVCTARGYSYPTAREAALKLMETAYLSAHAFSGADLMHGPIALVSRDLPVLVHFLAAPVHIMFLFH